MLVAVIVAGAHARPRASTPARSLTSGWSPPRAIDQIGSLSQPFTGEASCVSTSLCVVAGVDAVATSTDPAGGPAAWHTALLPGPVRMVIVSCPSTHQCVGSFGFGRLAVSRDPTGGPRAWHTVRLPSRVDEVNDLACPNRRLCVLVGSGGLAWSNSPLRGPRGWHSGKLRGVGALQAISCPSTALCVAAGDSGNLAVSTDPRGGIGTWHRIGLHVASTSVWVTCPSAQLCVGSDGQSKLLVSTDPAGGRRAWRQVTLIHDDRGDLDPPVCPSVAFCIVGNGRGTVWTSTEPEGGAHAWHRHRAHFAAGVLACAGLRACVASDQGGDVAATSDPLRPSHWRRLLRMGGNDIRAVACPAPTLCVVGDDAGNLLSARGPRATRWRSTGFARALRHRYGGGEQVLQVACASATTCLATVTSSDDQGDEGQLYAFDPARVSTTLRRVPLRAPGTQSPEYVNRLSCPTRMLCELDDHRASGRVIRLASLDPADPASWAPPTAATPPPRSACPSATRCLAPAGHGRIALFARRGARFVRTGAVKVLFPGPVHQVSCSRGGSCVVVGLGGVAVSDHPMTAHGWRFAASEPLGLLPLSAACASRGACVAVGLYGKAVSTRLSPATTVHRTRR